jgi:Tol biopolymer transport system component
MITRLVTHAALAIAVFSEAIHAQAPSAVAIRFLTADPAVSDYGPYFSPDSGSIVFARRGAGSTTSQLFVVSTSGGPARPLLNSSLPVSATRANWSAHDNSIAFTGTYADGRNTIWIVNGDGSAPHQLELAGVSNMVYYPSWYPDGRRLAFLDAHDRVIRRVDRDSSTVVTLTNPAEVFAGMPSVSPDGRWIAFAGQKNAGQRYDQTKNSIWLLTDKGTVRPLEKTQAQGRTPAWSPDGEWLTFESNRGSDDPSLYAVFIIRRDGSSLRQITTYDVNANHPIWSRNGRYITFSARHTKGDNRTGIAVVEVPK